MHAADILDYSRFLSVALSHKLIDASQRDDLMERVWQCDVLVGEFQDYKKLFKEEALLNLQIMLYKLSIYADGFESAEELRWYLSNLHSKRISQEDALNRFDTCLTDNINLRDIFALVDDLFGPEVKWYLVEEMSSLLATDGLMNKQEYIFLMEVCNQIGLGKHYSVAQYERDHKFSLAIDRAKALFM